MPYEAILRFLRDPASGTFDDLARRAFAFQYDRLPAYRRLCEARRVSPDSLEDWREIPPVPTAAFRSVELATDPPETVFRSSGTSGGPRSVHRHPYLELYRNSIDRSFPRFCLAGLAAPPILGLVPTLESMPDSSLGFMADHVARRFGGEGSLTAFGERGVDVTAARSWLGTRQREGRPVLVFATSFAMARLLDALERRSLHFRLPPGSVLFETGGYKGRHSELSPGELAGRTEEYLAISKDRIVREYGMTELTSQCYTETLLGGDPRIFVAPHWVRVRILDPESMEEAEPGEEGLISVVDLANLGSAVHVLTEDLGRAKGGGFRLSGRAGDAELRGCSLTVEELERA